MPGAKTAKEAFVSHLGGTSLAEVTAASAVMPLVLLAASVHLRRTILKRVAGAKQGQPRPPSVFLEFTWLALPPLLVLTERVSVTSAFVAAAVLATAVLIAQRLRDVGSWDRRVAAAANEPRLVCLIWYRTGLLLMTAIAILAVDFPVFPRRFAKAENYGTGLMDIGPGSFMFAQGLMRGAAPRKASGASWGSVARSAGPLLVIGVVRVAAVKSVEYQEHVSEYGMHWNFFITLAAVVVLAKVAPLPATAMPRGTAGLCISFLHQALLLNGLGELAMSDTRGPGLLSLNKEGLLSLPGYAALHCVGWGCGGGLRWGLEAASHPGKAPQVAFLGGAVCAGLWLLTIVSAALMEPICRRTCNFAYVLWVTAHNCSALAVYAVADVAARDQELYLSCTIGVGVGSAPLFAMAVQPGMMLHNMGTSRRSTPSQGEVFHCKTCTLTGKMFAPLQVTGACLELPLSSSMSQHMLEVFLVANLLTDSFPPAFLFRLLRLFGFADFIRCVRKGAVNLSIDTLNTGHTAAVLILLGYLFALCATGRFLQVSGLSLRPSSQAHREQWGSGGPRS